MAEKSTGGSRKKMIVRHRGRGSQIWIYLGKLLRTFIYQNDWKVLPMSALIAGLVGMVIRRKMFLNMEGTIMGSFAIVCVCIWNGCFNSIQSVCRERDVIKREHRSGMHISSYIVSHMIYQLLICLLQTGITLYITALTGVQYPEKGLFTPWLIVDLGISMLLITYASDMLSLWVSTIARTSTTAMTIMPFILIFQLVFSGGMITIPEWAQPFTNFTISSTGLKVVSAQADTNNRPFVTISDMIHKMRSNEINVEFTVEEALNQAQSTLSTFEVDGKEELNEAIEKIKNNPQLQEYLSEKISYSMTVGEVLDYVGENKVGDYISQKASEASYKAEYENSKDIIMGYWGKLALFIFVFSLLAMITLEFIDKDKR